MDANKLLSSRLLSRLREMQDAVSQLPFYHRMAFAAACCERRVPIYYAFAALCEGARPEEIQDLVDTVWLYLKKESIDTQRVMELLETLQPVIEHTQEKGYIFGMQSYWLTLALDDLLHYCLDKEVKRIAAMLEILAHGLTQYLHYVNYPSSEFLSPEDQRIFDDWVDRAPLIEIEFRKQREEYDKLAQRNTLDPDFLDQLRHSARSVGIDPIGIGLVPKPRGNRHYID
jgi:uncharacterized protein